MRLSTWIPWSAAILLVLEWCNWLTRYSPRDALLVLLGASAGGLWQLRAPSGRCSVSAGLRLAISPQVFRFFAMVLTLLSVIVIFYFRWMPFQWLRLMDVVSIPRRALWYDSSAFASTPLLYRGPSLGPLGTIGLAGMFIGSFFAGSQSHFKRWNLLFVALPLLLGAPGGVPIPVLFYMGWSGVAVRVWVFAHVVKWALQVASRYQTRFQIG